jgi:hypothetical protein
MDTATFTAATASMDQWSAAVDWAARQWPENGHLTDNARINKVVRLAPDTVARNGEDAHLLYPSTAAAVPVAPGTDLVGLLRAHAPMYAPCDYCDGASGPVAGLVPVVAPPQIVVLALCVDCLVVLTAVYPTARFILTSERTEQ